MERMRMDSESESSKRYVEGCRRILNEFESHERAAKQERVKEVEPMGLGDRVYPTRDPVRKYGKVVGFQADGTAIVRFDDGYEEAYSPAALTRA
jgi:hypothetical protein